MNVQTLRLQPGDQPFSHDADGMAYTMPARLYHDPDVWQAEKDAIFYCSWVYAGHVSQVAEPGQYLTTRIHDQNIFVARNRQGDLKAFYNVCAHRGHELLRGQGKTNVITCPYHAWAFDFDGNLRRARNSENVAGFRACDFSLKPVRLEVLCGLIFLNLDPDAPALAQQSGDLEAEIRDWCPRVDELVFAHRDTYDVASNWKVLIDNYLECYHCEAAHRDFCDLVDMDNYHVTVHDIYSTQIGGAKGEDNNAFRYETGDREFGFAGWFLWPNLSIWVYPGEPNISVLQMNPTAPERCIEFQDWFALDADPSPQMKEAMAYQKDVLQPEDISLCESVQRGLKSHAYNQGRFIIDNPRTEQSEHAVHHFQSMVVKALGLS